MIWQLDYQLHFDAASGLVAELLLDQELDAEERQRRWSRCCAAFARQLEGNLEAWDPHIEQRNLEHIAALCARGSLAKAIVAVGETAVRRQSRYQLDWPTFFVIARDIMVEAVDAA